MESSLVLTLEVIFRAVSSVGDCQEMSMSVMSQSSEGASIMALLSEAQFHSCRLMREVVVVC